MNPRTKLSVILILSLGFFASTATIVRIVYIRQLQLNSDYSWFGINLVKWSMVEPAIGITAAAIATLRPLFAKFLTMTHTHEPPKPLSSSESSYRGSSSIEWSSMGSRRRPSGQEYTAEFAEMLGLQRYGVTTRISAAKPLGWKERRRMARRGLEDGSMTELNDVKEEEVGWEAGIKRTTVVVIER